jgi:ABC-type sugar transport system permease subunit
MSNVARPPTSPRTRGEAAPARRPQGSIPQGSRWRSRDKWAAVAFLAPNLVLFSVFVVIPVIAGVLLSFFSWDLINPPTFVGLDNYVRLFGDPQAMYSLGRTLLFMLGGVIPTVVLGLVIATLINARFRGIEALRTLYYMPFVISFVASAVLWQWIYEPQRGLLNWLLSLVGIDGPPWLSSTTWALPSLVLVLVWLTIPLSTLLYLAALQRIPDEVIEASKLDGAGPVARIWHVIWPMVRPATLLVSVVMLLAFAFGSFDLVAVMTQGGPLRSTNILIYYMYDVAFNQLSMGYASALAVFQFLVVFSMTGVLLYANRVKER